MAIRFEWDKEKARQNAKKHGVTFEEAATFSEIPWLGFMTTLTIPVPKEEKSLLGTPPEAAFF